MYCKIYEQVVQKERLTDVEYINYLENKLTNIAARLNHFVSEFEYDLEMKGGKNLKDLYLRNKHCLTEYPK